MLTQTEAIRDESQTPRLRILHLLEATLGGTLRYLENIAESLSTKDFSLGFAYGSSRADSRLEPFLQRIQEQGWAAFPLPMLRAISPRSELHSILQLRQTLQAFRPDILHCHSSKAGVIGRIAAQLVRPSPKIVYSPHALAVSLGKQYLYIERAFKGLTDDFLAVSESESAQVLQYGLAPASRIHVAYPMVDTEYFKPAPNKNAFPATQARTVLGIGRLTAQKDPLAFIRIVRLLQQAMPEVRGVWVGDGELRGAFEQMVRSTEVSQSTSLSIELVPWQHDVRPYLHYADVLLSTSVYESFGYMVAEALAMEIPAVATNVTGTRDILSGPFADHMFPKGDDVAAVTLLQQVLTNCEQSNQWATRARAMIQNRFSREAMGCALRAAYQTTMRPQPTLVVGTV